MTISQLPAEEIHRLMTTKGAMRLEDIPLVHLRAAELLKQMAELEKDAERYRWIADRDRERYVSVHLDFGPLDRVNNSAMYKQHRVCWHDVDIGWVDAAGNGLDAAIDAAMQDRS